MSTPTKLQIEWQKEGRCLWHTNCPKNAFNSGIMREVKRESDRTLLECLHCGQRAYFPVGGVCVCVPAEAGGGQP